MIWNWSVHIIMIIWYIKNSFAHIENGIDLISYDHKTSMCHHYTTVIKMILKQKNAKNFSPDHQGLMSQGGLSGIGGICWRKIMLPKNFLSACEVYVLYTCAYVFIDID